MTWRTVVVGLTVATVGAWCALAAAEEQRSITQLPRDVAQLALGWMAVPQTMYDVAQDEGALAGVTVGTVEGSGRMVTQAVTYLTSGYHDPARPNEPRPAGALLHYAF